MNIPTQGQLGDYLWIAWGKGQEGDFSRLCEEVTEELHARLVDLDWRCDGVAADGAWVAGWSRVDGKNKPRKLTGADVRDLSNLINLAWVKNVAPEAAVEYEERSLERPTTAIAVDVHPPKGVLTVLGRLHAITYEGTVQGTSSLFEHTFGIPGSEPDLMVDDANTLHIVGGHYEITDRGIEDLPAPATGRKWPTEQRLESISAERSVRLAEKAALRAAAGRAMLGQEEAPDACEEFDCPADVFKERYPGLWMQATILSHDERQSLLHAAAVPRIGVGKGAGKIPPDQFQALERFKVQSIGIPLVVGVGPMRKAGHRAEAELTTEGKLVAATLIAYGSHLGTRVPLSKLGITAKGVRPLVAKLTRAVKMPPRRNPPPVPADATWAIARYSIGGEEHQIEGPPGDLYNQLDILIDIYPSLEFHGAWEAQDPRPLPPRRNPPGVLNDRIALLSAMRDAAMAIASKQTDDHQRQDWELYAARLRGLRYGQEDADWPPLAHAEDLNNNFLHEWGSFDHDLSEAIRRFDPWYGKNDNPDEATRRMEMYRDLQKQIDHMGAGRVGGHSARVVPHPTYDETGSFAVEFTNSRGERSWTEKPMPLGEAQEYAARSLLSAYEATRDNPAARKQILHPYGNTDAEPRPLHPYGNPRRNGPGDSPFLVGETLELTAPDGLSVDIVQYRGKIGTQATVVLDGGQFTVPAERLSRPTPKDVLYLKEGVLVMRTLDPAVPYHVILPRYELDNSQVGPNRFDLGNEGWRIGASEFTGHRVLLRPIPNEKKWPAGWSSPAVMVEARAIETGTAQIPEKGTFAVVLEMGEKIRGPWYANWDHAEWINPETDHVWPNPEDNPLTNYEHYLGERAAELIATDRRKQGLPAGVYSGAASVHRMAQADVQWPAISPDDRETVELFSAEDNPARDGKWHRRPWPGTDLYVYSLHNADRGSAWIEPYKPRGESLLPARYEEQHGQKTPRGTKYMLLVRGPSESTYGGAFVPGPEYITAHKTLKSAKAAGIKKLHALSQQLHRPNPAQRATDLLSTVISSPRVPQGLVSRGIESSAAPPMPMDWPGVPQGLVSKGIESSAAPPMPMDWPLTQEGAFLGPRVTRARPRQPIDDGT